MLAEFHDRVHGLLFLGIPEAYMYIRTADGWRGLSTAITTRDVAMEASQKTLYCIRSPGTQAGTGVG